MTSRDFSLAKKIEGLGDDVLINVTELAAMLCLAEGVARQAAYRNPDFPKRFPMPSRHLRWRLGDVRDWISRRSTQDHPHTCDGGK